VRSLADWKPSRLQRQSYCQSGSGKSGAISTLHVGHLWKLPSIFGPMILSDKSRFATELLKVVCGKIVTMSGQLLSGD
jgi:hypothetical protein